jgi:hypothetical protein
VRFDPLRAEPDGEAALVAWPGEPLATPSPPHDGSGDPSAAPSPPESPIAPPLPAPAQPAGEPPRRTEDGTATIRGTISGAAATRVSVIVIYGPGNLLKEAARVEPDASGSWVARGLAPGTYRIVPDAGGAAQLASDPPYRTVEAIAGEERSAPPIVILRAF